MTKSGRSAGHQTQRPPPKVYEVRLKSSVDRDLKNIPQADLLRIKTKIDGLATNPRPPGVEKLESSEGFLRVRVGDYRIIYTVEDKILLVLVVRVGHRREVYR